MSFRDYSSRLLRFPEMGLSLDVSLMDIKDSFLEEMKARVDQAFQDLQSLESGEIANPDEQRMVGHYWLRNPQLAPNEDLRRKIEEPLEQLKQFAKQVHEGTICAENQSPFKYLLVVGIGGSALGPQLLYEALGEQSPLETYFLDNTDPEGIDRTLRQIGDGLRETLVVVISKSGGTPETRNGMLEVRAAYEEKGLNFGAHAVAITGLGSRLDQFAREEGFLTVFPMEDWVGGRTSVLSTVGLVPMALQNIDFEGMLAGAAEMDEQTRKREDNPALALALAWYNEGNGKGEKDMVVLPYKDSLGLMSKYLQQLVMESLGKEKNLDGDIVQQGIAVYGNKGSTDQHAYIQQLRDGLHNFFATFIEVRKGREGSSIMVEDGVTSADFLQGFLRGTRRALYENGRHSLTISIPEVNGRTMGHLIALFERAVSLYASLVHINAYHQPGVEAGKAAAGSFLELLKKVRAELTSAPQGASEIAKRLDLDEEDTYHSLVHLSSNGCANHVLGANALEDQFTLK